MLTVNNNKKQGSDISIIQSFQLLNVNCKQQHKANIDTCSDYSIIQSFQLLNVNCKQQHKANIDTGSDYFIIQSFQLLNVNCKQQQYQDRDRFRLFHYTVISTT